MKLGCCAGVDDLAVLEACEGLDYVELPVSKSLMGGDGEFEALGARLRASRLSSPAVNVFLPATLKVVGPDARPEQLAEYAARSLARARQLGVSLLVFGSGAARMVPDGFSHATALDQFEAAVRVVHARASEQGITLALEPLHSGETNLLNTVGEAAAYIRDRRLEGVRVVADLWHMECERESFDVLDEVAEQVAHAHVAAAERRPPGQGPDQIESFLGRLRQAGYDGACSIECNWTNLGRELPVAVTRVREAAASAGWDAA